MKWVILTVAKPSLPYAAEAVELYLQRLRAWTSVEFLPIKTSAPSKTAALFLGKSEKTFRIVLDETGELLSTRKLAQKIDALEQQGISTASLIIGPAEDMSQARVKRPIGSGP